MARIHSFSLITYLVLQFLLGTSHAYQHRHLRRTLLYHGQSDVVRTDESGIKQQKINDLRAEIDAKLILRDSAIQLLGWEASRKEKRWHGDDGGNEISSSTIEELQQKLEDLDQAIQSLYDLLSTSFGTYTQTTTLYATATSTITRYHTTSARTSASSIAHTTQTSLNATATMTSSWNNTASSSSSSPIPTAPTATSYIFDPMSSSNVAVYYGQTDQTSKVALSTICADADVDMIILAFINKLSTGSAGYPTLNMGPRCWAASSAQAQQGATGLIDCVSDGFADQIKSCQHIGKKVLLSIGGAVGYSETNIESEEEAVRIANNVWDLFGAGGMDNESIMAIRPFGDVILDGFDIGKKAVPSLSHDCTQQPRIFLSIHI